MRISVCSASAVRFIGTQRPSIAIENDVSTSSATAAWVRASVSCTSTSPMSSRTPSRGSTALGDGAHDGVGHRAGHVPRLGVAERPLPGGAGALARRAGVAQVALALAARTSARRRRAAAPCRAGASPSGDSRELAVGAALEVAGVAQRLLEPLQGAGVDRGLVAELAGQLVEVEVVHPGAVVGLRELLGELVEVGEVLEDAGAVAEARAPARRRSARSRPSPRRGAAPAGWRRAGRATPSARASRTPARRARQLVALLLASSSCSIRCAAAARWASASSSSSMFCGFSGKKSPCLSMNSSKSLLGVLAAPVLVEQLVEVAAASR